MPEIKHCPHCGVALSADAPGGLCLRCLAQLGVAGPASETGADTTISSVEPLSAAPAGAFGDYELLEEIGRGGMGVVHKARQLSLNRLVALKVIKPGMDSAQVLTRFEAERQALALMDHPNIARVFDAGVTPAGRPYFAMELVQGVPITRFCDEQRMTIHARLDLFMSVCHAIQHAHQKGIIHRDIKPGNVLVTVQDGKPVAKVIDFGVAKAIGARLTKETLATEIGAVVGTLEYMSPEQARLDQLDIDTRSDIYALGILLYELLTGTTPLNRKALKEAAFEEVLRLIREKEPPRPSTRLMEELAAASTTPSIPKSKTANRKSKIPPDLDWIVMKALEKDRARRYETATNFAQDVQRYLAHEPVLAGPPTATYRLKKFIGKHAIGVAAAAACTLLLTTAASVSTWQWRRADRQRRVAESSNNRLELQRAEELLGSDNARLALAMLARNLRDHPEHYAAQERLVNLLNQRTFLIRWLAAEAPAGRRPIDPQIAFRIALSPDAQRRAIVTNGGTIALVGASSGRVLNFWKAHTNVIRSLLFSPDGSRLLSASADGTARLWEANDGRMVREFRHLGALHFAGFNHAGTTIATAARDGAARFLDARTGDTLPPTVRHSRSLNSIRFSPDDSCVVTSDDEGVVRIWSAATGLAMTDSFRLPEAALDANFTEHGTGLRVVTGGVSGFAEHWLRWTMAANPEVASKATSHPPRTPPDFSRSEIVVTSPDGTRQATASLDGTVRLWDILHNVAICDPIQHGDPVNGVSFSPDSRWVATSCAGSRGRVWDASTGHALTDWFRFAQPVSGVEFSAEGRQVVFATPTGRVAWPLHQATGNSPLWLSELAEAIAGVQFTEHRLTRPPPAQDLAVMILALANMPESEPLKPWANRLLSANP